MKMLSLSFSDLYLTYKLLIRNRLWNKLNDLDKAFFKSCLKLSKIKKIFNRDIIGILKKIISKARNVREEKIEKGKEVAMKAMNGNAVNIINKLKEWYRDEKYLFWLGLALSKIR